MKRSFSLLYPQRILRYHGKNLKSSAAKVQPVKKPFLNPKASSNKLQAMTRTHRGNQQGHSRTSRDGKGKNTTSAQRQSQVSRTLSKVLRHQAEEQRIPITKDGWVRLSDLLAWRGLGNAGRFEPAVSLSEVFDVVEDDGLHGKGRFGLQLVRNSPSGEDDDVAGTVNVDGAATGEMVDLSQNATNNTTELETQAQDTAEQTTMSRQAVTEQSSNTSKNSPETLHVILYHRENPDVQASAFLIRATQGHSMKTIESEGLLSPITLEDPTSLPATVVHGTFYGAWERILASGGLKAMSRNMVHFASGPALSEVLPTTTDDDLLDIQTLSLKSKKDVDEILSRNKVISGMRWDAQILIYIDLKRMLQDAHQHGWDMKWWRSDNGVILTEGVALPVENEANNAITARQRVQQQQKLVSLAYFDTVVEIKAGHGILWSRDKGGKIKDLPASLSGLPMPRGKGRVHPSGTNRGRGNGQQRMRDDDYENEEDDVGKEEA